MSVIGAPGMTASTAPKNPTAIEAARLITAGRVAPRANAMTRFTGPATPPFTAANQVVSVSAMGRWQAYSARWAGGRHAREAERQQDRSEDATRPDCPGEGQYFCA
jgi:hypothetical protein